MLCGLADMEHLRGETTDLSERDVPKIEMGLNVVVLLKLWGRKLQEKSLRLLQWQFAGW